MRLGMRRTVTWQVIAVAAAMVVPMRSRSVAAGVEHGDREIATFAGGCFWSMVHPFDSLPGVVSVVAGYTGGTLANPSYSQVSSGGTGHVEAVEIRYDPRKIGYAALLQVFWHNVDPLDANGQFCDHGEQYRSEIFYHDSAQQREAEASEAAITHGRRLPSRIVTQILSAGPFYVAEDSHQGYYSKHPIAYGIYRWGCGRDRRLQQLWGSSAGQGAVPPTEG